MESEYYLYHHGILGQKWGVRRFQNEDGTLTPAGRRRINTQKERTLSKLDRKSKAQKRYADYDKQGLKDLKENGINSERLRTKWEWMSEEEKTALAGRGGYNPSNVSTIMTEMLFGAATAKNSYAMKQLLKEETKSLEKSHAQHIEKAKEYSKRYEALSMKDVEKMASEYGYKEAKKQIRRS